MKKIYKQLLIISVILSVTGFSSCVNLEEDARSQITTENFYKTDNDAIAAVQSIYSDLTHNTSGDHASIYNRQLVLAVGMLTDDHIAGVGATNPDVRSLCALTASATNTRFYELWRQHYEAINRANSAISRIPGITGGDAALKTRLVLEARFLRGLLYYNLVRLWGEVPLVTQETTTLQNLQLAKSPVDAVYKQIIDDFTAAADGLPLSYTGADGFRATKGAARAFLINVYVTRRDYNKALEQYNIISTTPYSYGLFPSYADNFVTSKENTVEHIFDANFIADGSAAMSGKGNVNILSMISTWIYGYETGQGTGYGADQPLVTLRGKFKASDTRTKITFKDSVFSSAAKVKKMYYPHFYKYWDPTAAANLANNGVNAPIIRYSEVLLFAAEAKNELSGPGDPNDASSAYALFNKVYKRARPTSSGLTTGLTKEQFRDSIFNERQLEFVYEQIRFFDLIRINGSGSALLVKALQALPTIAAQQAAAGIPGVSATNEWVVAKSKNVSEKFLLLPIPATELLNNKKLVQNDAWK
ncbi:RagB/SusD domain protein [Paludibacter propionicigenes WB4]|uniref:RagB/SusD domain protein n=1 Tax=Paludibacter propionicigenes (strain DSM 17365 / JCM 13257 / WB4) TaxID=694427 RepID=E4T4V2_PALPW|nr:RagB/SusD family nutrient uptake outer membrane protein [Paludibacter propionicigenes]ADQ79746.1 RagB/SusD domain protein [Paludibacter propionicigenes WB4]